jgi:glycosyltransferase involved in cell wall biosynthesis
MKKKVLIFSLVYFPNPNGGAEPAIKEITDRIDANEIEFHMITCLWNSSLSKVEKVGNVLVHRIGFGVGNPSTEDFKVVKKLNFNKYYFQLFAPIKAGQLHFKYKYDGIWAMMAHSCGVPAGIFKTFFPKVKYILTLQEGDPIEHIEKMAKKLGFLSWYFFERGFTKADIVQTISYYLGDWAKKMNDSVKIVLIKNGANPNDLNEKFSQIEIEDMKIKLGKKIGDIYLVNTSRVAHQKGIDTTIQALKFLPEHIKFLIVGDGDKMEEYKNLAENLGLSDRVMFTGRVDRNVVTLYRKVSDIFVGASRTEGLGNAFVSALASRLPLVTTGVGGIADYAFDGKTAWIVRVEDPQDIAEKVLQIIADPIKAGQISENARKMVEEDYDWDKIAIKMKKEVFDEVLI